MVNNTDPGNPSNSNLVVQKYDGSTGSLVQDLVAVRQVAEMHLPYAQLAYLPACSTAKVIHLVSWLPDCGIWTRHWIDVAFGGLKVC